MGMVREAIIQDRYPQFVKDFFSRLYNGEKEKYPTWAVDALKGVGVDLLSQ
jgi:queuine tRNA-ribosyltransferase